MTSSCTRIGILLIMLASIAAQGVVPRFEQFIPAGRSGWLKLFSENDQGLFGAAINFNAASSTGSFNQGHNLHTLTHTAGMAYTIPVFPPSC